MSTAFIGRARELDLLKSMLRKKTGSLVVVNGRRRIGKSRLITEFGKKYGKFYSFTGLVPTEDTAAQSQRNEFSRQLGKQFDLPHLAVEDWGDLLTLLAKQLPKGQCIVLLDEISWIGSKDPDFLGKLKIVWDTLLSQHAGLMLILCGSVSPWIEKNILSNTGFFGRIALTLTLEELPLGQCNHFLVDMGFKGSAYEKFKLLSVTGGVPWYLEQIKGDLSADENIKQMCFTKHGLLVGEFEKIFHDLFDHRGTWYKKIIKVLSNGPSEYSDICKKIGYQSSGRVSEYLDDLVKAGFVSRDYTWHIKSGKEAKLHQYRLRDNYLRFYLKYIEPNISKVKKGQFEDISMISFPAWSTILGFQFENLVLHNRRMIHLILGIRAEEIVSDNPYFQRKTTKHAGCQVDYLVQTKYNTLFLCEIKFSKQPLSMSVVHSVKEKLTRLALPKGFSCFPVLIHVNGIVEAVEDSGFFTKIIDFGQLIAE